ncbi:hypothetical protein ABT009_36785 [Streptomyces sp. NPDC002896]|uniref:protein-L-isoaspartate O-methyltransferase family protein n=1 Tax=Streptomyces sp. NPDC002896 TaxID=3154438 RepID=UPI0033263E8D
MTTDPTPAQDGLSVASQRAADARAAMVARLEGTGELRQGPVREALRALPREVLMPQAYVRRSRPEEKPPRWDMLDWSVPGDREELLGLLYGGESVLIQHSEEPILGRVRGARSGGAITSMSSTVGMTAALLQDLELRPGDRVLDVGTGAGVTAAVSCWISGGGGVVTLDRDEHITAAARARLADLGHHPTAVTGDGEAGWPAGAPYDRLFVSYAVPRVAEAWGEQLAPEGRALAHVSGTSPSWPGLAVISKTVGGRLQAVLRAVEFGHRPGHGFERVFISHAFLNRIKAEEGSNGYLGRDPDHRCPVAIRRQTQLLPHPLRQPRRAVGQRRHRRHHAVLASASPGPYNPHGGSPVMTAPQADFGPGPGQWPTRFRDHRAGVVMEARRTGTTAYFDSWDWED